MTGYQRTDPSGGQEGHIGDAGKQSAPQEVRGVGDEDLLEDLQACRAGCVEDLCGREGLYVVGSGHLDVPEHEDDDADSKHLKPAKDIGALCQRWLADGFEEGFLVSRRDTPRVLSNNAYREWRH